MRYLIFLSFFMLVSLSLYSQRDIRSNEYRGGNSIPEKKTYTLEEYKQMSPSEALRRSKAEVEYLAKGELYRKAESVRDPIQTARVIEFDAKKYNYERYLKSPCFRKIGFNLEDVISNPEKFEKKYKICEEELKMKDLKHLLRLCFTILIFSLLIYFLLKNNNRI